LKKSNYLKPDFSRYLKNPTSIPLPYKERGFDFSPFPTREGGWGVRSDGALFHMT